MTALFIVIQIDIFFPPLLTLIRLRNCLSRLIYEPNSARRRDGGGLLAFLLHAFREWGRVGSIPTPIIVFIIILLIFRAEIN